MPIGEPTRPPLLQPNTYGHLAPRDVMNKVTIQTLQTLKSDRQKFAVVAAYDASFSKLLAEAGVDVILVGDSLGMTVQGHNTTVPVTIEDVCYHTQAVKRGNDSSLIIGDLPFMTYSSIADALLNSTKLMQAGSHMVKLEGGRWLADTIKALSDCGIPVCAHLGLTPQSVNKLGGYKVQGRDADSAQAMIEDAMALEAAGADLMVLECVPSALAKRITEQLSIPVIGIGAGVDTDAQVLVIYDMLGISPKSPKFSKNYLQFNPSIAAALAEYVEEVKRGAFPSLEHSFE
jgi:3-methyl-2-oxobutanoate hydroxymethyltransferase